MIIAILVLAIVYFLWTADKIFYASENPNECFAYAARYCAAVFILLVVLSFI